MNAWEFGFNLRSQERSATAGARTGGVWRGRNVSVLCAGLTVGSKAKGKTTFMGGSLPIGLQRVFALDIHIAL